MSRHARLLFGISVFWLALSVLLDGVNTLVLPFQLSRVSGLNNQATSLGLFTFVGLLAGALIQPVAGTFSDRWRPKFGRKGFIGIGLALSLIALFLFAVFQSFWGILVSYLAIQVSASIAQAGQQGLIPDLAREDQRGIASGLKGFMDIAGAMLGFVLLGQFLGTGRAGLALSVIAGILIFTYLIAVLLTPEDKADKNGFPNTNAISLGQIFHLDLRLHPAFWRLVLARFLFLLGIYGTGRFLLLFVAQRLQLPENQAAKQAGNLLAGLALITVLASPLAGWLSDRIGRVPLMVVGAILSAVSSLLLTQAKSSIQILLFGGLMSLGSAAFAGGSWALLADLVPKDEAARFFGLANFSTAGASAAAGLFGPLIDATNHFMTGAGFSALFFSAALAFLVSIWPLKELLLKEIGERNGNKRKKGTSTA